MASFVPLARREPTPIRENDDEYQNNTIAISIIV